ncbi:TPR repeat-containing protein [Pirellula staleyi DSM 6068]|uniref:TPR repeat-containing protein n=1 Tax=Pirellula staleyi (strain ATCC 27377 / DSM 6068 / ICPB 4128) TaxID=530564 RepID=D2R2P1_PIRSD|nr:tetratricopeptide repeat protein [Pirellula staleyi]ADB16881.1 TPR repeat-containing protein [Pirellula staleyi DSM 6068]
MIHRWTLNVRFFRKLCALGTLSLALATGIPHAFAAGEGQAELDQATELQLSAETLADLEKIITLTESALKKGLDDGQAGFAKEMLAATAYQHAERLAAAIFEQTPPSPKWPLIRQYALRDLEKALANNPKLPDAHVLLAKLNVLPGGDTKIAMDSLDEAIKLLKKEDNVRELSKILVLRAALSEDEEKKLADLSAAVDADPENVEAWQGRALIYLEKGENDKAVEDLKKLVEKNGDNPTAIAALSEAFTNLKKYDEALAQANKLIEVAPKLSLGYTLRSRIYVLKDDLKSALKDLDEALEISPDDLGALLLRSRLHAAEGNDAAAKADVEKALAVRPDLPQAIMLRSLLAAQKGKIAEAVADLQLLLQADPQNAEYRLQLASYYVADKRPRKAIEVLDQLIENDAANSEALRVRGDALLSIGKHKEAIADYEKALSVEPDDTGVLNNLAWVMATSKDDSVRNSKRSIELGMKACELTKFEKAHILSTLAAGYAEAGDWENAIKWSTKAVEAGDGDEVKDQLKEELEFYKQKKPWREMQETEENTKPLEPARNDLET